MLQQTGTKKTHLKYVSSEITCRIIQVKMENGGPRAKQVQKNYSFFWVAYAVVTEHNYSRRQ